ncbi:MAG: hypothetical protein ACN6OP_04355 [Pseudomonadales bacterium]
MTPYLKRSIRNAGLDPDNLPASGGRAMSFVSGESKPKAWKDIWGAGQGIGAVREAGAAASLIACLALEYQVARSRLGLGDLASGQPASALQPLQKRHYDRLSL